MDIGWEVRALRSEGDDPLLNEGVHGGTSCAEGGILRLAVPRAEEDGGGRFGCPGWSSSWGTLEGRRILCSMLKAIEAVFYGEGMERSRKGGDVILYKEVLMLGRGKAGN